MSYAIRELGLGVPPVTVERLGNRNVTMWRAVCDCGFQSKPQHQIGLAMNEMPPHGDGHRLRTQESWAEAS